MRRTLILTVLGLLSAVPPLTAQDHTPVGVERPAVLNRWLGLLEDSEQALEAGEWKKAKRNTDRVLAQMRERIEGGDQVEKLLGTASLLRAVAEAGLGNEEAAVWDFVAAQTLVPAFSEMDLGRFGDAAAVLDPWRLTVGKPKMELALARWDDEGAGEDGILPPRKLRAPVPEYPYAKDQACIEGLVTLQTLIDEKGLPKVARIVRTPDPLLAFVSLEALRDWRFEPASKGGEPVSVYYDLLFNYADPECENLFARKRLAQEEAQEKSEEGSGGSGPR